MDIASDITPSHTTATRFVDDAVEQKHEEVPNAHVKRSTYIGHECIHTHRDVKMLSLTLTVDRSTTATATME